MKKLSDETIKQMILETMETEKEYTPTELAATLHVDAVKISLLLKQMAEEKILTKHVRKHIPSWAFWTFYSR